MPFLYPPQYLVKAIMLENTVIDQVKPIIVPAQFFELLALGLDKPWEVVARGLFELVTYTAQLFRGVILYFPQTIYGFMGGFATPTD
jgi:hypothetical protein